ncbi:AsmA family protein [Mucilaginibacter flavus]|uniref:AsmA family protein n=1 Tax=Mucilaginibacter flavus TaxID=931504 RepID=UPI0025B548AD|nr:AsmA family protein [Mucilaginibacter flavus]MDN3583877.1 AsmA family protein [Mucilaginibacter flavus]
MPKWIKIVLKVIGALVAVVIVAFVGITMYIVFNKEKVLKMMTTALNKNLNGTLTVGKLDPTFFRGFPGVSVTLKDVVIKDAQWNVHHHTLLDAKDFDVSVNAAALFHGSVQINKIDINDASIDLFTDSTGYSNTSVFKSKPKDKNAPKDTSSSSTQIKRFTLNNVNFVVDDRKAYKLFKFEVQDVDGRMEYPSTGWHAYIDLKTLVKSFAFNTRQGSFMKGKQLYGKFDITYNEPAKLITVAPEVLNIGEAAFTIGGKFNLAKPDVDFVLNIVNDKILWTTASHLLSPNISKSLDMFNIDEPIAVTCDIAGSFGGGGDPSIFVTANVKDNVVTIPGNKIENCSFKGIFSNNYVNGKGFNDDNSVIKLYHFNGTYKQVPFTIDTAFINNLNVPVATGIFKSHFDIAKLNHAIGDDDLRFTKGYADLKLAYKADLVNFKISKPKLAGTISVKNADVSYVPRNLNFKNTAFTIKFAKDDLLLNGIRLQTGNSVVFMEGRVNNFLNLYYTAPEKILLSWQVRSPQLHLAEFLGFLNSRQPAEPVKSAAGRKTNINSALSVAFEKGRAEIHLRVDKVYYKNFLATDATADFLMADNAIKVNNVSVKHAGGSLKLNGNFIQSGAVNDFTVNTKIDNVNTSGFFAAFNNFGMQNFTSKNLTGFLSAQAHLTGKINSVGNIVPRSLKGLVTVDLKKGSLLNFTPITSVGKFAFPFRDLKNIKFENLNMKFDVDGDKINISPMQINSSVLNMDVAGVYSMSHGTNIALDIPLRNPKGDTAIVDQAEKNKKRMKGIVLHILAADGDDGKIKIKWNKNRDKKDDKDKKGNDNNTSEEKGSE